MGTGVGQSFWARELGGVPFRCGELNIFGVRTDLPIQSQRLGTRSQMAARLPAKILQKAPRPLRGMLVMFLSRIMNQHRHKDLNCLDAYLLLQRHGAWTDAAILAYFELLRGFPLGCQFISE